MSEKLWWLKIGSLLTSASLRFAIDDRWLFATKLLERLRSTKFTSLAERGQAIFGRQIQSESQIQRYFDSKQFSKLSEFADSGDLKKLSRNERKLVNRATELEFLLGQHVPQSNAKSSEAKDPRVLFYLTNSLPHTHSGYAYRSQSTLRALAQFGIQVLGVTRLGYPITVGRIPRAAKEFVNGVPYFRLISWIYPASVLKRNTLAVDQLVELARDNDVNIIHTTTDYNNALLVAAAAEKLNVPWVYEIRGELEKTWLSRQEEQIRSNPNESEFYVRARRQEEACMHAADAVVALSEVSKSQLIERGIHPNKIVVIPNAVDDKFVGREFSRDDLREELGLPQGKIVGSVTSVVEYEGLDDLVRAAACGYEETVLIVGDGVYLPVLKDLARKLGVADRVIFARRQDNETIWKWYAAMDIFVVPRKDTLVCRTVTPIKPVMAQALGIPVIASDLPALREITGELANYVKPGDEIALARALNSTQIDECSRGELFKWAGEHTWNSNAMKNAEMYNRLLKTT